MTTNRLIALAAAVSCLAACHHSDNASPGAAKIDIAEGVKKAGLLDNSDGHNWPAYGRSYGEQHFSPLGQLTPGNAGQIGLVSSFDLPAGNPVSGAVAVDGVIYTATGYSIVRAIDAKTGRLLWSFDPHAPEAAGLKLRQGWGIRGLAYWSGRLYVGTQDGRLIAVDATNGHQIWSTMTVGKDDYRFISGPPRIFDGKVIIGHGGADAGDTRGYVTAYDAETGKQLWRFFTVPGDPTKGFEDETQRMAAKTWAGEWWKYGGGGTAWNTFSYDPETRTVFIGTGNGAPWNYKVRSAGKGDNLFLCSVVALDAETGKYKWHYQFNPGESWDYNASMDMQLADLVIDGKPRKVLMELPKNGFFYVIDRTNGRLISADKMAYATWADHIDVKSGRPVENPAVRFKDDKPFVMFPGVNGAHTWLPSAYDPKSQLVYLPVSDIGFTFDPKGFGKGWTRPPYNLLGEGFNIDFKTDRPNFRPTSALIAWDPRARKVVWRVPTPGGWGGGVLATSGGLVFQGNLSGKFVAYDGANGKIVWSFDAQVPVLAPPISYSVDGRQFVTVLAGMGTSAGVSQYQAPVNVDYRTQPRRVLTFALGGTDKLPKAEPVNLVAAQDPEYKSDHASETRGVYLYASHCVQCHGAYMKSAGSAPDLRRSLIPSSAEVFQAVVHDGQLVPNGMPRFGELKDQEIADLRQYLRSGAAGLRKGKGG